jgi:hypothetical protein
MLRLIERQEVPGLGNGLHLSIRDGRDRALPLVDMRPIAVAINHEHGHLDIAVALPRLVTEISVAKQIQKCLVVSRPAPRGVGLLAEAWGDGRWIGNAA